MSMWIAARSSRVNALVVVFAVVLATAGCTDAPTQGDGSVGTAQQQLVNPLAFTIGVLTQSRNEGEVSTASVTQLCVTNATEDLDVEMNWGDGSPVTARVFLATDAPGSIFQADSACPIGDFLVCGPSVNAHPLCANWTHTYDDGVAAPGTSYTVSVQARQPGGAGGFVAGQNTVTRTVTNVAPVVSVVRNAASSDPLEEGGVQQFDASLTDPGKLTTEIATVRWDFTNGANILEVATVICNCGSLPCTDGALNPLPSPGEGDEPLCGADPSGGLTSSRTRTLLDNGAFEVTVTVTDKDGASMVSAPASVTVANLPPALLDVNNSLTVSSVAGIAGLTREYPGLSIGDGDRILVTEGFGYAFTVDDQVTDPGIDTVDVTWDFEDSTYPLAPPGNIVFTKAEYPSRPDGRDTTSDSPADILAPYAGTGKLWEDPSTSPGLGWFDCGSGTLNCLALSLDLEDDDTATGSHGWTIEVEDIGPRILTWDTTAVSGPEGTTNTFTLQADSLSPSYDALDSLEWWVEDDAGTQYEVTGASGVLATGTTSLMEAIEIVSGCTSAPPADAADSETCEIRWLESDTDSGSGGDAWLVWVVVNDEDSFETSATVSVTISNQAPSITPASVVLSSASPSENTTVVSVSFTFADPAAAYDEEGNGYRLGVRWGNTGNDTDNSTVNLSVGAHTALPAGGFVYLDDANCPGGCLVQIRVCEDAIDPLAAAEPSPFCSPWVQATLLANVQNVPPTATIVAAPATAEEGYWYDLNGSFSDPAGALDEIYTWSWTIDDLTSRTFSFGTSTYAARATSTDEANVVLFIDVDQTNGASRGLTLTVTDDEGGTESTPPSTTIDVTDNDPQIGLSSLGWDVSDQESDNRLPFVAIEVAPETAADMLTTIVIDWGDGTPPETFTHDVSDIAIDAIAPLHTTAALNDNTYTSLTFYKGTGPRPASGLNGPAPYADSSFGVDNPGALPDGVYIVDITVKDEETADPSAWQTVQLQADLANEAPQITNVVPAPPGPIVITEGQAASFVVQGDDFTADDIRNLRFEFDWADATPNDIVDGVPDDVANPTFSEGRATHFYSSPGLYTVRIRALDNETGENGIGPYVAGDTVDVQVNNLAPTITDVFNTGPVNEAEDVTTVALVDNRGADILTFTWNINCPETVVGNVDDDTFDLAPLADIVSGGGPVLSNTSWFQDGSHYVCVRVCDDDGTANSCDFGLTEVEVVNTAPTVTTFTNGGPSAEAGGAGVVINLASTATDPSSLEGAGRDAATFTFDCGNGVAPSLVAGVYNAVADDYDASHNCTYADSGVFAATVLVDDGSDTVLASQTVTVTNLAPTGLSVTVAAVNEGATTNFVTSGATDIAADLPLTYLYDFQDDGVFEVTTFSTSASFTYSSDGSKNYRVRVCDDDGGCLDSAGTTTVNNLPPSISSLSVPASAAEGTSVPASVVATDAGGDPLLYRWNMTCGTLTPGVTDFSGAGGAVPSTTNTYPDDGTFNVCVEVCDDSSACVYTAQAVSVTNTSPTITSFTNDGPQDEGVTVTLTVSATDPGTDTLSYRYDCGDGFGPSAPTAATTYACTYSDDGFFTASVVVTDGDGGSANTSTAVVVGDLSPTFGATPVTVANVDEGQTSVFTVDASDNDPLTYSYDFEDDGTYDLVSSSNSVSYAYPADGTKNYRVRVCDDGGNCIVSAGTTVVSNLAPAISSLTAPASTPEGTSLVATVVATDPGGDPLLYRWNMDCGTLTPTATDFSGAGSPVTTASTAYTDEGTYNICVEVCDSAPVCVYSALAVGATNASPVVGSFTNDGPQDEGSTVTLTVVATDPGADTLAYVYDCGDGSGPAVPTAATTFACTYADNGLYSATVNVDDGDGGSATAGTTVVVADLPPTFGATPVTVADVNEGQTSVFTVAASDNDPLTYSYDFEDDGTYDLVSSSNSASYAYPADGTKNYRVQVCDDGGNCITSAGTTLISNLAPAVSSLTAPASTPEGIVVSASVVATDPGGDPLLYRWNMDCGTLTPTAADFSGAGSPVASSSTTYTDEGTYDICVEACDDASACVYAALAVAATNASPTLTSFGSDSPQSEGATVTLTAAATDPGADTLSFVYDCGDGSGPSAPTTATTFACTYADEGSYSATVTVDDGDGGSDNGGTVVLVTDLPPVFGATPVTVVDVDEGTPSVLTVDATDNDPLTYSFDFDDNGVPDFVSSSNNASYTYPSDGIKNYRVEVCDANGGCISASGSTLVSNVAPVIGSATVPISLLDGSAVTVAASGSDVGGDALLWTFTFRDSGGAQVGSVIGPQSGSVASATMPTTGVYTVDVSVTDTANAPNTPATVTLAPAPSFTVIDQSVVIAVTATPNAFPEGGSTDLSVTPTGTGPYLVSYDVNGDGDFTDPEDLPSVACSVLPCVETVTYAQNPVGDVPIRILVQVLDQGSGAISNAFVTVTVFNVAPTLAAVTDCSVTDVVGTTVVAPCALTEGDLAEVTLVGTDNPADTLSYSLVSGPTGVTIDAAGLLSWTPTWEQAGSAPGMTHDIVVQVTDSDGASAAAPVNFDITVVIIDTNANGVSDTQELLLNGGVLLPVGADLLDTDNDGISDLDEVLAGTDPNISDAPTAPIVVSPKDDQVVATLTPTLALANASSPRGLVLSYTFVVLQDDGVTEVDRLVGVSSGAAVTEAVWFGVPLVEDTPYLWYGFADDGTIGLTGSPVFGFESNRGRFIVNAVNTGPGAPDPITPIDGSTFVEGTRVSLEARAMADPDGDDVTYVFEVATANTFLSTDVVVTSASRSVPFYLLPDPLPVAPYFWRAMATDGTNDSPWGATFAFTMEATLVNDAPTVPAIVSPSDEAIASVDATLTITASTDPDGDAIQYEFEIAGNAAFVGATNSGLQDAVTFAATGLTEDQTYFWRVRATDGQLASDWASAMFVVDASNGAPEGLVLLAPSDGALVVESPARYVATLAEDPEGDALTYDFEVASDDAFTTIVASGTGVEGDGIVAWDVASPPTLEEGERVFWRVTVSDGTNSVTANASFTLFQPLVVGAGGGCNCSATESGGNAWFGFILLVGFAALRGRRRRS